MDRRRMIGGLSALVGSSTLGARSAMAQASTMHMWVGFPPGGQGDIVARLFAEHMFSWFPVLVRVVGGVSPGCSAVFRDKNIATPKAGSSRA